MKIISLTVTLLLLISSCYYDKLDEIHPLNAYQNPCDSSVVNTYTASVQLIMANNCLSCHSDQSASGGISLQTYTEVVTQVNNGNLMGAILGQNGHIPMPPSVPIQSCEITKLNQWITNNMPQ
jgi:hypothetical protein